MRGYRPPDDDEYYAVVNVIEDALSKLGRGVLFPAHLRDLLAILGTGRLLHRNTVIQLLWHGDAPDNPDRLLRIYIRELREALQGSDYRIGVKFDQLYQLVKVS